MWRYLRLARTLADSGLRAAISRVAPFHVTIAILSAIAFGPTGLQPSAVTRLFAHHAAPRIATWAFWLIGATPGARALLVVPSTFALRALPAPRALLWGVPLLHLLIAEWPVLVLYGIGEGPLAAIGSAALAAAAHGLIVARPSRPSDLLLAGLVLVPLAHPLPPASVFVLGLVVAPACVSLAWRRAPDAPSGLRPGRPLWTTHGFTALAEIELRGAWRAERAVFHRAGLLVTLAAGAAGFGIANNHVTHETAAARISLAVLAGPLCAGLLGISAAVLRAERRLGWVLDSTGTAAGTRALAHSTAVAGPGALLGAIHATFVSVGMRSTFLAAARLVTGGALLGAALALASTAVVRRAGIGSRASDRVLVAGVAITVIATVACALHAEAAAASLLAAAALATFAPVQAPVRPPVGDAGEAP